MTQLMLRISAALALAGLQALPAQDRPLAIVNARILTMEGDPIERGTLVIRNGAIEALGADVQVPPGAEVVDAKGGTLMPGLVSAYSRAGLEQTAGPRDARFRGRRGRRMRGPQRSSSRANQENRAAVKAIESLYPRQEIFGELLQEGVTTLALTPTGKGLPGTGAILDPSGEDLEGLTANDDAFLLVAVERDAAVKKVLKDSFEQAKKIVEERKKPKEQPKPAEEKSEEKPAQEKEQKGEAQKEAEPEKKEGQEPEKKPEAGDEKAGEQKKEEKKKDPNLEVLADLLEGKRRAVLEIGSAADLLHYRDAVGDELKYPTVLVVTRHDENAGTVDMVLEKLKGLESTVLLPAAMATRPRTNHLTHPASTLHEAGIEIGFHIGDRVDDARRIFFRLMELVRCGLPREVALKGVTIVPAKCLAIEEEVGSLKPGKAANLLLLSGDPLDPTSRQVAVWHEGQRVEKGER